MPQSLTELWQEQDHFHATIEAKLTGLLHTKQFDNFRRCGREQLFRHCKSCHAIDSFSYHCDIKWCPRCQHRITARRSILLRKWSAQLSQPKHLVLTQRNFTTLTRSVLRRHTAALSRLRRTACFKPVRGGCVSVELTNETRGWHLHSHWLLDSGYLDIRAISREWARQNGQDQDAIVKIKALTDEDYVAEVSKYVVKPSEIASWPPDLILQFVHAITGLRFFFQFGTLFKLARKIRAELNQAKTPTVCECGCDRFLWLDETTETIREIKQRHG